MITQMNYRTDNLCNLVLKSVFCSRKPWGASFVTALILSLFAWGLFAAPSEYEKIQELDRMQRTPPPDYIERPRVAYQAMNLRDPFQSSVVKAETTEARNEVSGSPKSASADTSAVQTPLPTLNIQGIVWGGIFPQAIINNKVVKVGDTIKTENQADQIIIVAIAQEGVTVFFRDKQYKLSSPATGGNPSKKP